jgi:hypothetical protein
VNRYKCPVCRYPNMVDPPEDHEICPCCGTEFGYDDYDKSFADLRTAWVLRGAPWFSRETKRPPGWNAMRQLGYTNRVETTIYPRGKVDLLVAARVEYRH